MVGFHTGTAGGEVQGGCQMVLTALSPVHRKGKELLCFGLPGVRSQVANVLL